MLFPVGATALLYGAMLLEYTESSQAVPTRVSVPLDWKGQLMGVSQASNKTIQAAAFNRMSQTPSETRQAVDIISSEAGAFSSGIGAAGGSSESVTDYSGVVSSWILMTLSGGDPAPGKQKKRLNSAAEAIRTALAEALDVCRASVHVTDVSTRAPRNSEKSFLEVLEAQWVRPSSREHTWRDHRFQHMESVWDSRKLARMAAVMRKASHIDINHNNFTFLKASYEIRIFPEMRVPAKEMASRIDRLQIFSRFVNLNHVLMHNILHGPPEIVADAVMLDDVGYALRDDDYTARSPPSTSQLADCIEDGLLQDARETHQYVIAFCCILVLLITCAGSAVFSMKQPSLVPSRAFPLLAHVR